VETKGSLNDFTSSEAIPGLKIGKQPEDDSAFEVRTLILQVVKATAQGFAALRVWQVCRDPRVQARAVACFAVLQGC
jgi:hypothetical protein